MLDDLKASVDEYTRQYIERIELSAQEASNGDGVKEEASGKQDRLNKILATFEFDGINE